MTNTFNKLALISLVAGVTSGCGEKNEDETTATTGTVFSKSYTLVTGTPTIAENSVSGTGTLNFADTLVTARAEETNFLLTIDLSAGNDSFVALHSFANADLTGGQVVTMGRGTDGSFAMQYTKADGTSGTKTTFNETINAAASFTFSVEVHNGEDNGSHVIAWSGDAHSSSAAEATDGIYGAGKYTGLNFQNATITAFTVGAAEAAD